MICLGLQIFRTRWFGCLNFQESSIKSYNTPSECSMLEYIHLAVRTVASIEETGDWTHFLRSVV